MGGADMGTGVSGKYYTSHGSKKIHHQALIHSAEGEYTKTSNRLQAGGHGQDALNYMEANGIRYNIVKTFDNGVRVGNIPNHKDKSKRTGANHAWFPKNWTQKDIVAAAEHVSSLKSNVHKKDGEIMWGKWKKVWVGAIRTNGNIATVFPDTNQSNKRRR